MVLPVSQSPRHISVLLVDPDKDYTRKVQGLLFSHFSEFLDLVVVHSLQEGITHLCAHLMRLILMGPVFSDHRVSDAVHTLRLSSPNSAFLVYGMTPDDLFRLDAIRTRAHKVVFISSMTPETFQLAIECALARTWQPPMDAVLSVTPKLIHDLNNAVTAINGFGDILLTHSHTDVRNRVCVEQISKAGARAAALLQTVTPHTSRSSPLQHEDEQCTTSTG